MSRVEIWRNVTTNRTSNLIGLVTLVGQLADWLPTGWIRPAGQVWVWPLTGLMGEQLSMQAGTMQAGVGWPIICVVEGWSRCSLKWVGWSFEGSGLESKIGWLLS